MIGGRSPPFWGGIFLVFINVIAQDWDDEDADSDSYSNGEETSYGTDPYDPSSYPGNISGGDMTGGYEDPYLVDTDGDTIPDYDETSGREIWYDYYDEASGTYFPISDWITTDSNDADTDNDGLDDGVEWDLYNLGWSQPPHWFRPTDSSDGLADWDSDGLSNALEINQLGTNILSADSDGDGVFTDYDEWLMGTNPLDPLDPDPTIDPTSDNGTGTGNGGSGGTGGDGSGSGGTGGNADGSGDTVPDGTGPDGTGPDGTGQDGTGQDGTEPETANPSGLAKLAGRGISFNGGERSTEDTDETGGSHSDDPDDEASNGGGGAIAGTDATAYVTTQSWDGTVSIKVPKEGVDAYYEEPPPPPYGSVPELGGAWSKGMREVLDTPGSDSTVASVYAMDRVFPQGSVSEVWLKIPEAATTPVKKIYLIVASRRTRMDESSTTEGTPTFTSPSTHKHYGTATFEIATGETVSTSVSLTLEQDFPSGWTKPNGGGSLMLEPPLESPILNGTSYEGGEDNEVNLLPVDIKEAWSDQIKDVEANGMPDMTGYAERPYIFMGARSDGKGHAKLKLGSALPEDVRDKVLFRLVKSETEMKSGTQTYEENGTVVRVTLDLPDNQDDKDYILVVGLDDDENGQLSPSEVKITPKMQHKKGSQTLEIPITFTVVSENRYEDSRQENLNLANNPAVKGGSPNAAALLRAFSEGVDAPDATNVTDVKIGRKGWVDGTTQHGGLTHPVGVAFIPTVEPGDSIRNEFDGTTRFALDMTKTQKFRDPLHSSEIQDRFADWYFHDLDAWMQTGSSEHIRNPVDEDVTFSWTWEELTGSDSLNFAPTIDDMLGLSATDIDMWVALGKVEISGTVEITANWSEQRIKEVRFTGTADDVYDFDYADEGIGLPGIGQIRPKLAAEVQAGHPTLTPGGRVTLTRLTYDDTDLNIVIRWDLLQ